MCDQFPAEIISGNEILSQLSNVLKGYKDISNGSHIAIILFKPGNEEDPDGVVKTALAQYHRIKSTEDWQHYIRAKKYKAACISKKQKKAILEALGCTVRIEMYPDSSPIQVILGDIDAMNRDKNIKAIIVQNPIPSQIIIDNCIYYSKDIDSSRDDIDRAGKQRYHICATAEGISRVLKPFLDRYPKARIAINGFGFVGSSLFKKLTGADLPAGKGFGVDKDRILAIDTAMPKKQYRINGREVMVCTNGNALGINDDFDIKIVVSAASEPIGKSIPDTNSTRLERQYIERLDEDRIELIVDAGFDYNNEDPLKPCGNLDRDDYDVPYRITPVPGGVGPLEMAIIAERLVNIELIEDGLGELEPWRLVFNKRGQLMVEFPGWREKLKEKRELKERLQSQSSQY
jgi:5,10-methylene-tetrahydrofolate dehydrogenase/methenyl tetrahydrofolate cyclohydrolase